MTDANESRRGGEGGGGWRRRGKGNVLIKEEGNVTDGFFACLICEQSG